jgi:hypothetical protein
MLTVLLTNTRAHCAFLVTCLTQRLYISVSVSSLKTSARMLAMTMRHVGPRTEAKASCNGQVGSAGFSSFLSHSHF